MKKIIVSLLFTALPFAFGCKKSNNNAESMSKMTEYRDRMCACTDSACARRVSDDMTKWSQDRSRSNANAKLSEADTKQITQINEDMGRCMQKAMSVGAGSAMGADTTGTTGTTGTAGMTGTSGTTGSTGSTGSTGMSGTSGTSSTTGTTTTGSASTNSGGTTSGSNYNR